MGKLRLTMSDGKSRELSRDLDIKEGSFGREGFEFQCRTTDGRTLPIAHGDVAVTRFKGDRCHFRLFEKGDVFYVQDMGSGNGTFLDGKQLPGFVSGKGSEAVRLPEKCRLKVGQREITFEVLSTAEERKRKRILEEAQRCMESGNYKRAQKLYLSIKEYELAKKAKKLHEDEKIKGYLHRVAATKAEQFVYVDGNVHGQVTVEKTTEDLRGLDADTLMVKEREKQKGKLKVEKERTDKELNMQKAEIRARERESVLKMEKEKEQRKDQKMDMGNRSPVVHDSVSVSSVRECSCCLNLITASNKRLRCKNCSTFFCEACEGWIDKIGVYRGVEIHVRFPLCEKCYTAAVERKKQEIDGG